MIQIPLLQIAPEAPAAVQQVTQQIATEPATLSLWDLAVKGGWIMIVLLLLSLVGVYIFVVKLMELRKAKQNDESFVARIKDYLQMGRVDSATALCREKNTPEARMIEKGLKRLGQPASEILPVIENVGAVEVGRLERGLPLLATVAGGAPMIGFLGTVTGMVRAFFDLANAPGGVDVTLLSSGIYEALVTTIGGLIVGVIALFAYNYLVGMIDRIVNNLEAHTLDFMDVVNDLPQKSLHQAQDL